MDEARRRHYLRAMGVQVWELRDCRGELVRPEPAASEGRTSSPLQEPPAEVKPDLAAIARDWGALQEEVADCLACPLHATRTHAVFGSGNPKAQWMVIGEAPGEQEDLQGKPFVGRAGQLLTEMLRAIGLDRDKDVFITNVLKSRPPGNRDPKPEEVAACEPFLVRQIAWIKPKIILSVGRISAQNLLKTDTPIGKLRGKVHRYQGIPLVVTYHPAYLLRSPLEKRKAWDDLCLARRAFSASGN
jgi:DNA polymerase